MMSTREMPEDDANGARRFYRRVLTRLLDQQVPFLVGGSFAFAHYTGIHRRTKDLDLFIRLTDWERVAASALDAGWQVELSHPHWLGKLRHHRHFVDIIFNSGNGVAPVDDDWFRHAVPAQLMGLDVQMAPVEESLWTKAFIMERERFDGADVAHLLLACARVLDWQRLLRRFGAHWRVLLAHLVLFGFIFPGQQHGIPAWLMDELRLRLGMEPSPGTDRRLCAGTLLSREQYQVDVLHRDYLDARLLGESTMRPQDIADWSQGCDAPRDRPID
jgi:predicted nucleotidyltransferase